MTLIDVLILELFLITIILIGFQVGRKIRTFNDYAIGNRNFSDFALFCTAAATMIGGSSTIGLVGQVYKIGITQILVQIGIPIAFLLVAIIFSACIQKFYGCLSIGDIFYKAYGLPGKFLGGILTCIYESFNIAVQFMAMAVLLSSLTGYSYNFSLYLTALIIFIYTGRGGIRAVTFTDVLQFMIFVVGIPMLAIISLDKVGGFTQLLQTLPKSHLTISNEHLHRYLPLFFIYYLPCLTPHTMQRLLMSKNKRQGLLSYSYASAIYSLLVFTSIIVGLCAYILYPNLPMADKALPTLMRDCLPIGIYGFVTVSFLAVLMSSADSLLNVTSVAFVNDLVLPFCKKSISEKRKLQMAWIFSLATVILACVFAQNKTSIFEFRIFVVGIQFSMLTIPLYWTLANRKISNLGFYMSMLSGFIGMLLGNIYLKPRYHIDGLIPGFLVNLTVFSLFYFFGKNKGVIFSKEKLADLEALRNLQSMCGN